jgi:uncharacterized protein (UPF0332 family)
VRIDKKTSHKGMIIWHMLTREEMFKLEKATDKKLTKKSEVMRKTMGEKVDEPQNEEQEKTAKVRISNKTVKKTGVAREIKKKAG